MYLILCTNKARTQDWQRSGLHLAEELVSFSIRGPNGEPPATARTSQHYGIEGLQGSPIMPRDSSLSDSRSKFFQSVYGASVSMIREASCRLALRSFYHITDSNKYHYSQVFSWYYIEINTCQFVSILFVFSLRYARPAARERIPRKNVTADVREEYNGRESLG